MDDADTDSLKAEIARLKRENSKLKKINRALVERVETATSDKNGPYRSFEHAVFLAEQVHERTAALNAALADLTHSNQALKHANTIAQTAHQHLIEAIESISDAFVLFDKDQKLLLCNTKFSKFWHRSGVKIKPGIHQQEIKDLSQRLKLIDHHYQGVEEEQGWNDGTLPGDGKIFRLRHGSWMQVCERQTGDGGMVVVYKDITALMENERAIREKALAKKSKILQNTLDNLSQGVVLVNDRNQIEAWNQRFIEVTGLKRKSLRTGSDFSRLMSDSEVIELKPTSKNGRKRIYREVEQQLSNGTIVEIKTHPMPNGQYVNTITDITERSHSAKALQDSEHRLRLITDAVPALISYVDSDLTFKFTNRAYEAWYRLDRNSILGRKLEEVLPESQLNRLKPYVQRALAGETVNFEIDDPTPEGEQRYVVKSYVPQHNEDQEVEGFYVLVQDITEQRYIAEELRHAYQNMELAVADRTFELTNVNQKLLEEIQERREVESRLREAKKEAEQANTSKTKFLAAASHDLLQPMNAARLFAASLQENDLCDRTRRLVNALNFSLEDVESLLAALVDISKLDAGAVKPDITAFQASNLLNNLANEFQTLAHNADLRFDFISSSAVIASDSQLLARILRNFLSNAIRYTSSGRILLGCRRQNGMLSIEVLDTGIGIPEDKLEDIFLEFNRINDDNSARDKGLGLGLAIVDKMARILNCTVSVRSKPGYGSCFSVQVPYGTLPNLRDQSNNLFTPASDNFLGRKILVVDNEISICQAMDTLLSNWGCQVLTATSYDEVKAMQEQLHAGIDLIIADYHLDNGETGLDASQRIRRELHVEAPVLMITANYTNELKQEVRALGYRMMNKPVRPAKLKALVQHMLGQQNNAA
ncbi:MAG: PAS-domain containing protein [Motiliproteus sp.]|nr:PAS-domain containing protein [Motiliproteus sp.]MCW9053633.1 PAS-domain containing protein [Motiliproteus sp.]